MIPAYQPSDALLTLVTTICTDNPQQPIIVVNDGSTGNAATVFEQLSHYPNVTTLTHAVNLGKGQALKTAINHYLLNAHPTSLGIVTADADGQHAYADIKHLMSKLVQQPAVLWLGSRTLNKNVPLRSRFGNALTRKVFSLIMKKSVYDTQTGLRGIPRVLMPDLLRIPTSGYEYELDMLLRAIRKDIDIREVSIATIYINDNESSHFNPLLDSLKVYFVFLRYLAASASSALVDFLCFALLFLASQQVFCSIVGARFISGVFNFVLCKKMIFKSDNHVIFDALRYLILAIFSLSLSYVLVIGLIDAYRLNVYVSKLIADVSVFFVNFAIQKVLVFPTGILKEESST